MRPSLLVLVLGCVAAGCAPSEGPPAEAPAADAGATRGAPEDALLAAVERADLIDLTHVFDADTLVWPTSAAFRLEKVADGVTPAGFYYAANNVHTAEHGGTHVDAPVHFAQGQQSVEQIPFSRLIGRALVVDVSTQAAADPDYLVTVDDLLRWEQTQGSIDRLSLVLLHTGYAARWPDAERYLGTAERGPGAVAHLHFPGLAPEAATWLISQRDVAAIGIDTASIDRGQSTSYDTHRALAAAGVPAFENLTMLHRLPARGAVVVALPMNVGGGSGAPLRAVAMVPRPPAAALPPGS